MPRKWDSCVKKVKAKQTQWCEIHGYPDARDPSGNKCGNPYKICSRLRNSPERLVRKIYTGPEGGKYYLNAHGKKVYVKHFYTN
jgi:hypothetical protein